MAPSLTERAPKCGKPALGSTCVRDAGHKGVCFPKSVDRAAGKLNFLSVTSVDKYDSAGRYGCPRKWGFEKLDGIREPQGTAQALGDKEHGLLEHYARTGEDVLSPISRAGKHFVYAPGPGLTVEHESVGELEVAGVPFYVRLDVLNERSYYLDNEGERRELSVPEACDWKTTADVLKRASTARELMRTVQMPVYGAWAMRRCGSDGARLSHGYFGTRKREALKVSYAASGQEIVDRMGEVAGVVERMKADASAEGGAWLRPNYDACHATARGCFYLNVCPVSAEQQLHQVRGLNVDKLLERHNNGGETMSNGMDAASLMARLSGVVQAGIAAPVPMPAPIAAPTAPAAYTQADVDRAVAARMAELAAAGQGAPVMVTGPAVQRIAPDLPPGAGYTATPAVAAQAQLGVLPPDAPQSGQSAPAAKAIPPEQLLGMPPAIQAAHAAVLPAAVTPTPAPVAAPPFSLAQAATSAPPVLPPVATSPATEPVTASELPKVKRVRPRKDATPTGIGTSPSAPAGGLTLLVDCVASVDAEPLEDYVDELCARLAEDQKCVDIRCADNDSALAFGKWKGFLAFYAKAKPPEAGTYTIQVSGNEARQVVVDALRPLCALFVRGVR